MSKKNSGTKFIIDSEFEKRSKESFYDNYYGKVTDIGDRWRDFGAIEKCKRREGLAKSIKGLSSKVRRSLRGNEEGGDF